MYWYQYELTVPAGETVVNTVTAPLYPDIHTGWVPAIYTYDYLLSPAKGWADFGTLEIRLNTPYYMTQCNLDGFEKTSDGYALQLNGLPDRELTFVLCAEKNPAKPGTHGPRTAARFGIAAVLLVVILLWFRRKR